MFTRKSASIIIGALAATTVALVVAKMAERRMRSAEEWERIIARVPPKDAPPPPKTVPPVEEQPVVAGFPPNPFAGRVFGKLVPTEEHAKEMQKLKGSEASYENIRDGAYLLAVVIPGLAMFLLWCGWGRKRETAAIAEWMVRAGMPDESASHQPDGVPNGDADSGQGSPETPADIEVMESLSAILRDLQKQA